MKARLGPLIVDERSCTIARGSEALEISRKAVELLILLGRAGKPVQREALLRGLWLDRDVSDKALSMLVVELRRHLMPCLEGHDPIQTLPGIGYSLTVPYEQSEFPAELAGGASKPCGRLPIAVIEPTLLSTGAKAKNLAACWHDTLLNTLSGEPHLQVRARHVGAMDTADQASTLIIRSSVRLVGSEVLLSVRCVTPQDEEICWSASERAPVPESLDAETRLCERLRQELQLVGSEYGGQQTWRLYRKSSGFTALAEGQRLIVGRTRNGIRLAREKFQQALELDPNCAPALVGMADCEILGTYYDDVDTAGATGRAMAYVQRALALNPELAAAHSTHGLVSLTQLRFENAERHLLEAIRLDNSSAIALQWYADFLASQGRMSEAVQAGHLAVARAPHSMLVNTQLGLLLHMAGAFEEAQAQLERVLEIDPGCAGAHALLGMNLALQGNARAIEHGRRAVELSPDTPFYSGALGSILARLGQRERALQQLHALEAGAPRSRACAEGAMLVACALGQPKRAIDWFRVSTSNGAAWALSTPMLPMLAAIREDPAFQGLIRSRGMAMPAA